MKLSMWMIANQISELDIKLEIREEAPAVLNSARLAYATNCVHIYREKDYVVCDGHYRTGIADPGIGSVSSDWRQSSIVRNGE